MKENKEEKNRRLYVIPFCEVITVNNEDCILAASPNVDGNVSVEDPTEDDEDTELSGAKRINMWTEWEE